MTFEHRERDRGRKPWGALRDRGDDVRNAHRRVSQNGSLLAQDVEDDGGFPIQEVGQELVGGVGSQPGWSEGVNGKMAQVGRDDGSNTAGHRRRKNMAILRMVRHGRRERLVALDWCLRKGLSHPLDRPMGLLDRHAQIPYQVASDLLKDVLRTAGPIKSSIR